MALVAGVSSSKVDFLTLFLLLTELSHQPTMCHVFSVTMSSTAPGQEGSSVGTAPSVSGKPSGPSPCPSATLSLNLLSGRIQTLPLESTQELVSDTCVE